MPVNLDWIHNFIAVKQTLVSYTIDYNDPLEGKIGFKDWKNIELGYEQDTRVRSYARYYDYIVAIMELADNGKIQPEEVKKFKYNGPVGQAVMTHLGMPGGNEVHLIFEKGSPVTNPDFLPTTALERVELYNDNDDETEVLWSAKNRY